MVLSTPLTMYFAYTRLFYNDSSFYLHSVVAVMVLAFIGFILISLSYNLTLGAGEVLLAFGIDSIMASSFNDPAILHFTRVGYLFVGIGVLLILVNIYSFWRRRSAKARKYYFFPRF